MKRLYRGNECILAGVCGGNCKYTRIDPVIIRLILVIVAFVTAIIPAVIAYISAAVIMPAELKNHANSLKRAANI
jgi:phage shock protein C